jgi:hypothetical protein
MNPWKAYSPELNILFKQIARTSFADKRVPQFRVSSLPYCPLYNLYQSLSQDQVQDYSTSFYTSVGTAIHETIQKHMALVDDKIPFGTWQCSRELKSSAEESRKTTIQCTHEMPWMTLHDAKNKIVCPHGKKGCGNALSYKELTLEYKGILSGHTDMLIKVGKKTILFDIKTCSNYILDGKISKPPIPYQEQIQAYAYILNKVYKIKVDYFAIVYVGREKSITNRDFPVKIFMRPYTRKLSKEIRKKLDLYVKRHRIRIKCKGVNKKSLEPLIEVRPCTSMKTYETSGMKAKFDPAQTTCPLLGACSKGDNDAILKIMKGN